MLLIGLAALAIGALLLHSVSKIDPKKYDEQGLKNEKQMRWVISAILIPFGVLFILVGFSKVDFKLSVKKPNNPVEEIRKGW